MATHRGEGEERVTALELFFDLVFVLAITQVTGLMAEEPTWAGVGKGMLVLAALWWSWVGYSWLTNTIDPEEGAVRLAFFAAMAAMLVGALAVPDAFGDDGVVFGAAYVFVRVMHIAIYAIAGRDDPHLMRAVRGLALTTSASLLILAAGFVDGDAVYVLWAVSLAIDYAGPAVMGPSGWRMHAHHFAERHGLIIIIALGESIVAIGVGAGVELTIAEITAAVLGIAVVAALWWAYFDVVALVAERKLAAREPVDRNRVARDSYSYLHLPMIAGIVLFALGAKKTLGHVDEPLAAVPAAGLCGGVALYLAAHVAFRLRNLGSLNRERVVATVALVALIPVAREVDALVALGLVAAVCVVLISYEAIRFRDARARVRHPQEVPA